MQPPRGERPRPTVLHTCSRSSLTVGPWGKRESCLLDIQIPNPKQVVLSWADKDKE